VAALDAPSSGRRSRGGFGHLSHKRTRDKTIRTVWHNKEVERFIRNSRIFDTRVRDWPADGGDCHLN